MSPTMSPTMSTPMTTSLMAMSAEATSATSASVPKQANIVTTTGSARGTMAHDAIQHLVLHVLWQVALLVLRNAFAQDRVGGQVNIASQLRHIDEANNVATVLFDAAVAHAPLCRWILGRVWFGEPLLVHGLNNSSKTSAHSVPKSSQPMAA